MDVGDVATINVESPEQMWVFPESIKVRLGNGCIVKLYELMEYAESPLLK